MTVRLWAPRDADELHHERGQVSLLRPIFQGDVFCGIVLPGLPDVDDNLAMLVTHPCSMLTSGAQYESFVEAVRVRPHRNIRFEDWPRSAYELLPLPEFCEAQPDVHYGAFFHERAVIPIPSGNLALRVAALSLAGVVALQQRLNHEASRVAVSTDLLEQATEPLWIENELLETWNEAFVNPEAGEHLPHLLSTEARRFDEELTKKRRLEDTVTRYVVQLRLQSELRNPDRHGAVRQAMSRVRKDEERRRKQGDRSEVSRELGAAHKVNSDLQGET